MILVDNQINDRVKNYIKYKDVYSEREVKPLIEGFIEANLQSASYDITMTNKIRKFKNEFRKVELNDKKGINDCFKEVDITYGYDLRPNEYILIQLNEYINMPDDLIAHIRPRTTFTKMGLILSYQHINPSYDGQLQLGLYNATPYVIELIPNLIIGQLVFEQLSGEADKERLYYKKDNAKYQHEKGFVGSKVYDEVTKKIDDEYERLKKKLLGGE
ncbi:dCTP deaminase [Clostridium botulinum]|uniref:dCTP deaminase n=1 Tax=Clostridium botulinum TaxID=1491 RepID=UPI00096FE239|nr:dCTP deaminase [Clostridium botulinum]NFC86235.1 dCTP deaminase [Clostridium botulinum]